MPSFSQADLLTYAQNRQRPDALLTLGQSASVAAPSTSVVPAAKTSSVGASAAGYGSGTFVRWAKSQVGTKEGSKHQRWYANHLGYSPSLPWCSIFVATGLKHLGVSLPSNPAYSGSWMNWKGGSRVKKQNIRPGDLIIYDWGDGGITDHVAIYAGNGKRIGGNQSNAVTRAGASLGQAVAIIRPKFKHHKKLPRFSR